MSVEGEHQYSKWEQSQATALENLKGKEVWVLFSGGKDSSLALYFLHRAGEVFDFQFTAHVGMFPKHRYTQFDIARIDGFWREKGLQVQWHDLKLSDDALKTAENPCALCQQVRKELLYKVVQDGVGNLEKLVLVTAYTVSDLISYCLEYVTGATCKNREGRNVDLARQRFVETAQRFYPILRMNGSFTVYRPILKYNRQDIIGIIEQTGVPILSTPCLYARFRPKRILDSYYESMAMTFDYDRLLEFARTSFALPSADEYTSMTNEHFLKRVF